MIARGPQYAQGLVVGKFAPFHRGHQFLVERALGICHRVMVLVYATPDFEAMPNALRASWVRAICPAAEVHVPPGAPPDEADDPTHRRFVGEWLHARALAVDAVFSSEAYGPPFAAGLGAAHEMVDLDRRTFGISGSAIRADIESHRQWLHPIVYESLRSRTGALDRRGR